MPTTTPPGSDRERLLHEVANLAAEQAERWFPELHGGRVRTRLVSVQARARCFLYRLSLDDGGLQRPVVVKVRHSRPELRLSEKSEGRPVLSPERTLPDHDTAKLEYDGLRLIGDALADADRERFGVLRALAWLPGHDAIVMDLVEQPTLRSRVLETSRGRRHRRRAGEPDLVAWSNAGSWLRRFHDHAGQEPAERRHETWEQVAQLYRDYADFLSRQVGSRPVLSDLRAAADQLAATLPPDLPLRRGHADFVANNMFVGAQGRVTVFDPLPRWSVPPYQDLATLVVGTRVLPIQAVAQGMALPGPDLDRYEAALLGGYFAEDPVPLDAARAFQLLVLLDRWAALVGKRVPHGRVRPYLRELRVRTSSAHYHGETRRLVRLLAAR